MSAMPSRLALEIAPILALAVIQLVDEARLARNARLLASDGSSRLIVSNGASLAQLLDACSLPAWQDGLAFSKLHSDQVDSQPRAVQFVSLSPALLADPLAALACGCQLQVLSLGSPPSLSTVAPESAAAPAPALLGVLDAPHPFPWLGACWHTLAAEPRDTIVRKDGLLAAICQAEVRVLLCSTPEGGDATAGMPAQSPALLQAARLAPPSPAHARSEGTGCAAPACRSSQCHVAWVGGGEGGGAEDATVTLLVGWGAELELVTWATAALRAASASAAAAAASRCAGGRDEVQLAAPVIRRPLLLGVPGPLVAMSPGPFGSVVATTAATLALALTTPLLATAGDEGKEELAGDGQDNGKEDVSSRGGGQAPAEVLDLRGRLAADADDGALLASLRIGGDGGGGDFPVPSGLAGLFNISSLAMAEVDRGSCMSGVRRPATTSSGVRVGGGTTAATSASTVPSRFLLGGDAAAAPPAVLCVVWPGRLVAAATAAAGGTLACAAARRPLDDFRSLAPLVLPRPDLLACAGSLILVGSSVGPPAVAAFGLAPRGGLTQLATIAPSLPGVIDPARGRLRGLVASLPPPPGAGGAAAWGSGGFGGASAAGAVLVVVLGEVDPAAAGQGIVGFSRTGAAGAAGGLLRVAPLVASAHPLPPQLAAHAVATAITAAPTPAAALAPGSSSTAPPVAPAAPAADVAAAAATPATASGPAPAPVAATAAASPDAVAAAVVRQLAELLGGLRRHVDSRLDELAGSLQAQAARLDRIEATVAQQQQQEQQQQQLPQYVVTDSSPTPGV